jgi:ectoine hydroxylase-related dioxygenase (phytanoyl-CoA dioxygenase family)
MYRGRGRKGAVTSFLTTALAFLPCVPVQSLLASEGATYRALKRLTDAHLDSFDRDGVIVVRGIFTEYVDEMREAVTEAMANPGPFAEDLAPGGEGGGGGGANFFTDLELCDRLDTFRQFGLKSPAAAVAGRLCGSKKMRFFYDQLFVKPPENPFARAAMTPWHQDLSYWAIRGEQVVSIFVALDDVKEEDCLQFVVGSHRWRGGGSGGGDGGGGGRSLYQPVHFATGEPYDDDGAAGDEEAALPVLGLAPPPGERLLAWPLRAGDCLAFHGGVVHGGRGSFGRALSLRYLGDDVVVGGLQKRCRFAVPTAWSAAAASAATVGEEEEEAAGVGGLPKGVKDGAPLDHPVLQSEGRFPLAWEDPLFGLRGFAPVTVQEWSKGVAVNEEQLDDWSEGTRRTADS